jgi:copper transport protein
MGQRGRQRRLAAASIAALFALAVVPSASAHATLVTTEPGNDAVLEGTPERIMLRFSEPVESAFGAVRVYDASARRVDDGDVSRPSSDTVEAGVDGPLARGTYTVTWRVVSADSHPVRGAFVFHVGAPGAEPAGIAAQVLEEGTPRSVSVPFTVVRFVDFALLLAAAGGAAALALVLVDAGASVRRRLHLVLAASATGLALIALAGIVLQGAAAGGFGIVEAARWDIVSAVADTRFGRAWLAQAGIALALAGCAVAAVKAPRAWIDDVALLLGAALVFTPALSGHSSVSGTVAFVADVAHVEAAAAWAGGLLFLALALVWAGPQRWSLAGGAVPRFSRVAVVAVAVLVAAGLVNGYEQLGAWRGLWDTTYGLLLLAKLALVLPVLALGAYNNRYSVPRFRAGVTSAAERRRFARAAGAELALLAGVVAVTAVLVSEPPARATVAPTGPFAATTPLGDLELNLVVDPARAGSNAVHFYVYDRSGQPVRLDELRASASLPSWRVGPLRLDLEPVAPGHWTAPGVHLALAGDWQLRVEGRRGEFEALTGTVSVPIRKES